MSVGIPYFGAPVYLVWHAGPDGAPEAISGRAEGVSAWSMPAAYVDHQGDFVVMY